MTDLSVWTPTNLSQNEFFDYPLTVAPQLSFAICYWAASAWGHHILVISQLEATESSLHPQLSAAIAPGGLSNLARL